MCSLLRRDKSFFVVWKECNNGWLSPRDCQKNCENNAREKCRENSKSFVARLPFTIIAFWICSLGYYNELGKQQHKGKKSTNKRGEREREGKKKDWNRWSGQVSVLQYFFYSSKTKQNTISLALKRMHSKVLFIDKRERNTMSIQ